MVPANDDGRLQLAAADHVVELQAHLDALAVAEPADARRQALELYLLARQANPARQRFVAGKGGEHGLIGAIDVLRIAGESGPAEWPLSFAEQRANVFR